MLFLSENPLKNHEDINILLKLELKIDGAPQIALMPLLDSEMPIDFNQHASQ